MIVSGPHIKAISIVGQKPTVGSEPLHVIGDDYCGYYVKNHKQLTPAAFLINEVMGHFLLKAWQINTPDIAFDMAETFGIKNKLDFKKYYQPEMFARIGLFDMWTENEDQPPDLKNIMLFEKEERYSLAQVFR